MRLILVRHGQSEGNASGVVQGRLDFGLSELGYRQAEETARRMKHEPVTRILTSPLRRASETARLIAGSLGMAAEPEPGLLEYDIGVVSGLTGAEIRERHPEFFAARARGERPKYPGEEGRDVFQARVLALLQTLRAEQADGTTVAVAHGGVINAACAIVLGVDLHAPGRFQVANCSLTEIVTDRSGSFVLRRQNDVCHLDGLLTTVDRG